MRENASTVKFMNSHCQKRTTLALVLIAMALQGCVGARPGPQDTVHNSDIRECLLLAQLHSTKAVSDREILFRLYGGEQWRNILPAPCTALRFNRGFTYDTSLHRLCRGQFIHTLEPGQSTCALGSFRRDTGKSPQGDQPTP